jgi:hypothetical protein
VWWAKAAKGPAGAPDGRGRGKKGNRLGNEEAKLGKPIKMRPKIIRIWPEAVAFICQIHVQYFRELFDFLG